jgi:serine protease Do
MNPALQPLAHASGPQRRWRPRAGALAGLLVFTLVGGAAAAPAPEGFADLAAKVSPAVVNVSAQVRPGESRRQSESLPFRFPEGSPFEEFFRRFHEQEPQPPMAAQGSGFIIDPTGYVVTNNHVVDGATKVEVKLQDGASYDAEVVGTDAKTDLALLKIDAGKPLPAASFGDSDAVRVGDWVMAVGNPFGLGGTVTAGIVSARGRDLRSGPFDDYLQIDASINQGNSGGPTFSLAGEVIGVNTAIATPNGGSVGIGFAIPSNLAKPVIEELRAHGRVERGWLGVQIQVVTPEIAAAAGLEKAEGAIVSDVLPDSPAAKAGLRRGDIILAFGGQAVDELKDLPRLVAAARVGDKAEVEIWRDHEKQTVAVEIARLKDEVAANDPRAGRDQPRPAGSESIEPLGLQLASLTPALRESLGIPAGVDGVVVTDVAEEGPAAAHGLRPGDVIEQVGSKPVTTPEQVASLAAAARAENRGAVLLLVNRQGDEIFVAVKLA